MKSLLDYTLRELKDISDIIDELVDKIDEIESSKEEIVIAPTCNGKGTECCKTCKWYNKGMKNMAYCACPPNEEILKKKEMPNPKKHVCEKYEGGN